MNKIKYKLLSRLQSKSLSRSEVYAKAKTINQTHSAVKELLQCGLISQDPVSGNLSIRPEGIQALEQEQLTKSQRCHDFWIATYGIIGGIIGGIISGAVSSLIVLKLQGLL